MPAAQKATAKQKTTAARNYARRNGREGASTRKYINTSNAANAALVDPDKPLTAMQREFVKHWAQGETILSATVKAGYRDGGAYGYRMARMPNVLALYQEEKLAYERASDMNRKKVMDGLIEAIDLARMCAEPSSMIAGWREVAKICGYYAPVEVKQTVTHEGEIIHKRLNQLSDAELLRMIEERANQIAQTGGANGGEQLQVGAP
jgi:phage terminase small subunit